jgi:hypothetical protein
VQTDLGGWDVNEIALMVGSIFFVSNLLLA